MAKAPQNYTDNVSFYPPEYFSGCDIFIKIKETSGLSNSDLPTGSDLNIQFLTYKVQANVMPIYHYTEPVSKKIWVGNRNVVGSFAMAVNSSNEFIKQLYGREDNEFYTNNNPKGFIGRNDTGNEETNWKNIVSGATEDIAKTLKGKSSIWDKVGGPDRAVSNTEVPMIKSSLENNKVFDIEIMYGYRNVWYDIYGGKYRVDTIKGCCLTDMGESYKHDAQPLSDIYTFQAADVVSKFVYNIEFNGDIISGESK